MPKFEKLNSAYLKLREELENDNLEDEQDVFDLEQQIQEELEDGFNNEEQQLKGLLNRIKELKKEFDLYDEDTELDRMFPDRHDDDFDEESMSPDSVFGDE